MNIQNALRRTSPLLLALSLSLFAASCSKKEQITPDADDSVPTAVNADDNAALGDSDSGKALGLETIRFGYDAFLLDETAKATLKANAQILKDKPSLKIQVEGHCDERGGIQYNIALGEKRANITRKFLVDQGIAGARITTISFGKEKPVDSGSNEAAWAKNRRANFVVTSR
jgi:peptidoglycan-associated lipoprotein